MSLLNRCIIYFNYTIKEKSSNSNFQQPANHQIEHKFMFWMGTNKEYFYFFQLIYFARIIFRSFERHKLTSQNKFRPLI